MKLFFSFAFLILSLQAARSQDQITTFILLRHAEKVNDGSRDPDLTEAGKQRALMLVKLLKYARVDAIYSTPFKRTQNTVAPLAQSKNIAVQSYDAMKADEVEEMLKKYNGGTIVVSGHSNTTPWMANYLLGKEQFKNFNDNNYDNLLIVSYADKGKASCTWLTY